VPQQFQEHRPLIGIDASCFHGLTARSSRASSRSPWLFIAHHEAFAERFLVDIKETLGSFWSLPSRNIEQRDIGRGDGCLRPGRSSLASGGYVSATLPVGCNREHIVLTAQLLGQDSRIELSDGSGIIRFVTGCEYAAHVRDRNGRRSFALQV